MARKRAYLASKTNLKMLLDFGGFPVFENASVDTCILIAQQAPPSGSLKAVSFKKDFQKGEGIRNYAKQNAIRHKMQPIRTPLKEWDIKINFGVFTGYNKAFMIDNATKERLVADDSNSIEIIKPLLRGRDIRRSQSQLWAKWWLIDTHNGCGDVPAVAIDDYPAIKTG